MKIEKRLLEMLEKGDLTALARFFSEDKQAEEKISWLEERGILNFNLEVDWKRLSYELLEKEELGGELEHQLARVMHQEAGDILKVDHAELAEKLQEDEGRVKLRLLGLEMEEIIQGYRPKINWKKLGYDLEGFIGVSCPEEVIREVGEKLKNHENVFEIREIKAGKFDLLLRTRFKSRDELRELSEILQGIEGVEKADVWLLS